MPFNIGDVVKALDESGRPLYLEVAAVEQLFPFTINIVPSLIPTLPPGGKATYSSDMSPLYTYPGELFELYAYLDQPLLFGIGLGGTENIVDRNFRSLPTLYAGPGFGANDELSVSSFVAPTAATVVYQLSERASSPYYATPAAQDFVVEISRVNVYAGSAATVAFIDQNTVNGSTVSTPVVSYSLAAGGSVIDEPKADVFGSLAVEATAGGVNVNQLKLKFKPLLTTIKDNVDVINEQANTSYVRYFMGLGRKYYITLVNIHNFQIPGSTSFDLNVVNLRLFGWRYIVRQLTSEKPVVSTIELVPGSRIASPSG